MRGRTLKNTLQSHARVVIAAMLLLVSCSSAALVNGYLYPFDDESQRQRFEHLLSGLRCPVCQNQDLANSESEIAADLRMQVYQRLNTHSDAQIVDLLVARYGDFVRYRPSLDAKTAVLWLLPIAILALALALWVRHARKAAL